MQKNIICISCGIFKDEFELFNSELTQPVNIMYLDSMLHMNPGRLKELLNNEIQKHNNTKIIIAYGDCYSVIDELEQNKNIFKIPGINCCEIILAGKRYKQLRKEGAFILIKEWVVRWRDIFINELGFKSKITATQFMREMHTKLVYLQLNNTEIPYAILDEISDFCGLPYFIENYTESNFINQLNKGINYLCGNND